MPLNIKDDETCDLVRTLASKTGQSLTGTVKQAVKAQLTRIDKSHGVVSRLDELDHIALKCADLPVLDIRSDDEIIGYDGHGLPK